MKFRIKLKIGKESLGYAAFAAVALIFFLYLRFPGDIFARYAISSLSAMNPDAILLIGDIRPGIPPGIRFKNIVLGFRDNPLATLQAETIITTPGYGALMKGRTAIFLTAAGYGGTVKGELGTSRFLSLQGPISARMTLDGLTMEKIGYLKERLGRQITGKLKGALNYSGNPQAPAAGSGNIDLTLSNGSYPLQENIMGFDRLDFKNVEARIILKNGILTINKLNLTGDKINASLSGDITLNNDNINSSRINLTCTLEATGQTRKLSMALTGVISNPTIRYM